MPDLVLQTVDRILLNVALTQMLLRSVVDGYTLFAFLRETPNVQSAVSKFFCVWEF